MTIRGGGNPNPAMAAMPLREWTRRLGKIEGPAWREAQGQSAYSQRYFLGFARRRTVARSSRTIRALYYGLQSLQSVAQGWHLGRHDGRHRQGSRRQGTDDRQFDRSRSSACLRSQKKSGDRCVGRSRGGITTKIHARVDAKGRPVCLLISPGEAHDASCADALLNGLENGAVVIADKAYDAD